MGFDFFENLTTVLVGVGLLILTWICVAFLYYRCLKPRCCPNRTPPEPQTSSSSPPPITVYQHVQTPMMPQPNQCYQPVPQFEMQNYPQQNVYYPQMPMQPPPSYYPPPPQYMQA